MVAAFAEFEKSLITTRLSSGRKTKARNGGYAGGKAPIGYKAERGNKALTLDQEKASTVKRVFEMRDANPDASLKKIADMLNAEGFTPEKASHFTPCKSRGSWIERHYTKTFTGILALRMKGSTMQFFSLD